MIRLPLNATDDQILAVCSDWIGCAVRDDYAAAAALLYAPPGEHSCTPDEVRTLVTNYGSLEPHDEQWHITSPETAAGEPLSPEVCREPSGYLAAKIPGYAGYVWLPVPLCGEWSDLVVSFDLRELEGSLVLSLRDVDVP